MLSELLKKNPIIEIGTFIPCPPVTDRPAWETLPGKSRWILLGNELLKSDLSDLIPPLPLSLWLEFTRTGNRINYEKAFFMRRRNLCCLVMAECFENSGRFIPAIADLLWSILNEPAWQLPAHNSYKRDSLQLPLPDLTRPVIDIFAAETGALAAMVLYLLGNSLDYNVAGFCSRIGNELEHRVIMPYMTEHFWWMGNGSEPMCNWTPWCTQNILITISLLHPNDTSLLLKVIKKASRSLDCFLKGYGNDGCCSEGAQYYGHAALCLFNSCDIMTQLAPGTFDSVWNERKIINMAEYINAMHVSGTDYFNFSDCSPKAGFRGAREFLYACKVKSLPLMNLASRDFCIDPDPYRIKSHDNSDGINLYYHVQTAFAEPTIRCFCNNMSNIDDIHRNNVFYKSTGLFICHTSHYSVAIKAGCNADSHNHNDTGSVILYKDGFPLLIDIGVESYTKKTFSSERYKIWTMQSSWHNLPEFDPDCKKYMQLAGSEYRARNVHLLPNDKGLSMDIAPAYTAHGEVPSLKKYKRTAYIEPESGMTISDITDYEGLIAVSLMSMCKPMPSGRSVIHLGKTGTIEIEGAERIKYEPVIIHDSRLLAVWPNILYRIRIYFRRKTKIHIF